MDYVNFVHIHELFRYSFKDFCENSDTQSEDKLPVVCIIALKGPSQEQVLALFKNVIHKMEEQVYKVQ